MFDSWIGSDEMTKKFVLSIHPGKMNFKVFDLSDIDENFLNQLIDESIETGIDKVYDAVKEYEMEIPEYDPNCIY